MITYLNTVLKYILADLEVKHKVQNIFRFFLLFDSFHCNNTDSNF